VTHPAALRSAYAPQDAPLRTPRALEYDLFARVTAALDRAWRRRDTDFPALVTALHDNTRLWSVLAEDVANPDNPLPQGLRAQLFYLYEFTAQHARRVADGAATTEVLVDINTAVMRGLRGERGAV
jgi:flagellar protein FlaF